MWDCQISVANCPFAHYYKYFEYFHQWSLSLASCISVKACLSAMGYHLTSVELTGQFCIFELMLNHQNNDLSRQVTENFQSVSCSRRELTRCVGWALLEWPGKEMPGFWVTWVLGGTRQSSFAGRRLTFEPWTLWMEKTGPSDHTRTEQKGRKADTSALPALLELSAPSMPLWERAGGALLLSAASKLTRQSQQQQNSIFSLHMTTSTHWTEPESRHFGTLINKMYSVWNKLI